MMNRNRLLLVLVLLVYPVFATAQTAPDGEVLTRLLNQFLDGAGKNDAAVHDRFWADDLIYTRGVGQRIDKAELMKGVRSAAAPKPDDPITVYTADEIRIQQYGHAAVVAFKLVGTTTKKDGSVTKSYHLNTGTFIKREGIWQAVAWQATPVRSAEEQTQAGTVSADPAKTAVISNFEVSGGKRYLRGPRGGCYYLNSTGKKTYVDKSFCK